jgi:hypothetical protein
MKKQMKRTVYEAPRTARIQVEMEGGFICSSADVENPNKETGKIEEHQTNQDFSADFGSTDWD